LKWTIFEKPVSGIVVESPPTVVFVVIFCANAVVFYATRARSRPKIEMAQKGVSLKQYTQEFV